MTIKRQICRSLTIKIEFDLLGFQPSYMPQKNIYIHVYNLCAFTSEVIIFIVRDAEEKLCSTEHKSAYKKCQIPKLPVFHTEIHSPVEF